MASSSHTNRHLSLRPLPHSRDMAFNSFGDGSLPRILNGQARSDGDATSKDLNIAISSTSKQAGQMIAPFLAEHRPEQHNPFSRSPQSSRSPTASANGTNTKYCYRHRPDLKCRRQANEPSMEQLQKAGCLSETPRLDPCADSYRNSGHYHSQISRALPMSGRCSPHHHRSIETSCSKAFWLNAAFPSSPSCPPPSAI